LKIAWHGRRKMGGNSMNLIKDTRDVSHVGWHRTTSTNSSALHSLVWQRPGFV
jgi:hypothetical protein